MNFTKIFCLLGFFALTVSSAQAAFIFTEVKATSALYFDDWGHPYTETWDGVTRESNERSGVGRGKKPKAIASFAGAFDFRGPAGSDSFYLLAGGEAGINAERSYGPNGVGGPFWRGLRLYSLIGVWSSTSNGIDPIGDPFFVGTGGNFDVPSVSSAYLFLGFNDGNFDDNPNNSQYNVLVITPASGPTSSLSFVDGDFPTSVPEPASLSLLLAGFGLFRIRRPRRRL